MPKNPILVSESLKYHSNQDARNQICLTYCFLFLTTLANIFAFIELFQVLIHEILDRHLYLAVEQLAFIIIISLLNYGNFVYQFTRLGYYKRKLKEDPTDHEKIEEMYLNNSSPLTILVPSYKEEIDIVRETLLSAALQDYPDRKVVLLIDDPPIPKNFQDFEALEKMRCLPQSLQKQFDETKSPYELAKEEFLKRKYTKAINLKFEIEELIRLYKSVTKWFQNQIQSYNDLTTKKELPEHTLVFMRDRFFGKWLNLHLERIQELKNLLSESEPSIKRIEKEYNRLANLFAVNFSSFERKKYLNLSHMPNKAMNLNSYIYLMGKSWKESQESQGTVLVRTDEKNAFLKIPAPEFLITLDADSLLLPDYVIKLANVMMSPNSDRIAVAQTPYSSIPGAQTLLEKMAGGTTDIQYQIHQGFTNFGATYWVGANAMLRYKALISIKSEYEERGYKIHRYIQDNTVIEDTESTIDLLRLNWTLYNYPQRLAYSATPSDFGSLLIQRRRWANGGLIILPKLLLYIFKKPLKISRFIEAFFRIHYLGSIAVVNIGLLILMGTPLGERNDTLWIAIAAIPYFFLYGIDLVKMGYNWIDVFRVYGLNLLLIPVNLGGVFMSLNQAITGKQIPFSRTPKVIGRTVIPAFYVIAVYSLFIQLFVGFVSNFFLKNWEFAFYYFTNAMLLGYAILKFIGLKASWEDIKLTLYKPKSEIGRTVGQIF